MARIAERGGSLMKAPRSNRAWISLVTALLVIAVSPAVAEPYLAVQKGMQCSACHSNPAGGGKRNSYGNVFAQMELPATRIGSGDLWTGQVTEWLAVGGNLRGSFEAIDTPNRKNTSEFQVNRGTIYAEAILIPGRLSVYVDQQFAPDASQNREAYVRLNGKNGKMFAVAGQFYLPFGLRLQDDTAFVRLATSINFTNPDRGLQLGYEAGPWSTIASVTNGSGGGREIDSGKQVSLVSSYVQEGWRAGVSANFNDADAGDRTMFGLFAGLKTGAISWLAEVDQISDDLSPGVTQDAIAGLIEANWLIRKGHNLKFSHEYLDPNDDLSEDHQVRNSLVWEYTPMQFFQARIGLRSYDGVPQVDVQNRDVFFAEFHGFF